MKWTITNIISKKSFDRLTLVLHKITILNNDIESKDNDSEKRDLILRACLFDKLLRVGLRFFLKTLNQF